MYAAPTQYAARTRTGRPDAHVRRCAAVSGGRTVAWFDAARAAGSTRRGQAGSPGRWPGDRGGLVVPVDDQFCGIATVPDGATRNVWPWGPVHS